MQKSPARTPSGRKTDFEFLSSREQPCLLNAPDSCSASLWAKKLPFHLLKFAPSLATGSCCMKLHSCLPQPISLLPMATGFLQRWEWAREFSVSTYNPIGFCVFQVSSLRVNYSDSRIMNSGGTDGTKTILSTFSQQWMIYGDPWEAPVNMVSAILNRKKPDSIDSCWTISHYFIKILLVLITTFRWYG